MADLSLFHRVKASPEVAARRSAVADFYRSLRAVDPALARRVFAVRHAQTETVAEWDVRVRRQMLHLSPQEGRC